MQFGVKGPGEGLRIVRHDTDTPKFPGKRDAGVRKDMRVVDLRFEI